MRRLIFLAAGVLAASLVSFHSAAHAALPQQGSQAESHEQGDDEKLNLTQDQKNQIKTIRDNEKSQIDSVRHDSSLTPEQKQNKIRGIRQGTDKQINGVLTPHQREELRERRQARRHHHRRNRRTS